MKKEQTKSKASSFLARKFRISEWADWSRIQKGGQSIEDAARGLFVLKKSQSTESFDDALVRMKITDEALADRARALLIWSMLALLLSIFLFFYAIYHFLFGTLQAGLLVFVLTGLALSLSFRYHFWYVQIKMRRLGCSFEDWFQYTFKGNKP